MGEIQSIRNAWNNAQVELKCRLCSKPFLVSPSKTRQVYCSKDCAYKAMYGRFNIQHKCEKCGKDIKVNNWKLKHRKHLYCSFKCRCDAAKNRVTCECPQCGKLFEKKRSQYSRCSKNFCSQKCAHLHHRGAGHPFFNPNTKGYGPEWKAIAEEIRERDGVCQRCGMTPQQNRRELDVHHIQPFEWFGYRLRLFAHRRDNLIAYCRSCHKFIEEERICNSRLEIIKSHRA